MEQAMEQRLVSVGVDIQDGIERFGGSRELYERFLIGFLSDPSYGEFETAIANKDWTQALAAAHTLKGVTANLSMTRLLEASSKTVALLREADCDSVLASCTELASVYKQVVDILHSTK